MITRNRLEAFVDELVVGDVKDMTRDEIKAELAEQGIDLDASQKRFEKWLAQETRKHRWEAFKVRVAALSDDALRAEIASFQDAQVMFRDLKHELVRADLERLLFDLHETGDKE
ncbi:MAG: hypothetical protein HY791_02815 [Deltaproteobacteria bacterium]|nr:hypothetical protein [Deltaproteobacteria bacterium]